VWEISELDRAGRSERVGGEEKGEKNGREVNPQILGRVEEAVRR